MLKLTCGAEFGVLVANRWIAASLQSYGEASIDADYTSRVVDLVHEGFDLALRVGELADSSLAARKLGELTYGLYAAERCLARRGALDRHALVMFSGGVFRAGWRLADARGEALIEGPWRLRVNNGFAARDAAAAGLGIALLPDFVARGTPRARVLPKIAGPRVPSRAVFPSARFLAPKVRAFVDLALELGAKRRASSATWGGERAKLTINERRERSLLPAEREALDAEQAQRRADGRGRRLRDRAAPMNAGPERVA